MKLHTKTLLAALTASAMLAGSADAANILWVDSSSTNATSGLGVAPDASWLTLLEGAGHTVTTFDGATYDFDMATQADKDYVEGFDIAIIATSNNTFNAVRNFGANWYGLSTALMIHNPYLTDASGSSSSSWNWGTAGGGVPGASGTTFDVTDENDPIWSGITLATDGSDKEVSFTSSGWRYMGLGAGTYVNAGISTVATRDDLATSVRIAYAEAGALGGAGSGAKYFFANGGGAESLSSAGEQAYLNAIGILVPEPSSLALLGLGGLLIGARRRRD